MNAVLERYLNEHEVTQAKLAGLVGVTQSLVSQWLTGARPISPKKAKAIEEATGGAIKRYELRPDIFDAPKRRPTAA